MAEAVIEDMASLCTAAERRAWRPLPRVTVAQWAEANRRLSAKQSRFNGPFRNARNFVLIGLMNLAMHPRLREIWVQKPAQRGVSEAVRCIMGYVAEREPDPSIFVMPDEEHGRKIIAKRIIPLFEDTPCLKALHTGIRRDVKLNAINLANDFSLQLGYSGSPTSLKSDPVRFGFPDEIDDFAEWSGRNADPVSMLRKRMLTYGNLSLIYGISTPTTDEHGIAVLVAESPIRLWYWVPCPHCGQYQQLTVDRLKWDKAPNGMAKKAHAALVKSTGAVWYLCRECDAQILPDKQAWMIPRGCWATDTVGPGLSWIEEDQHVQTPGGLRVIGGDYTDEGWPAGDRAGIQMGGLTCLWVSWADIAAETIAAHGDIGRMVDLFNQTYGEPFKSQLQRTPASVFEAKCLSGAAPRVVPNWVRVLIATADVQQNRIYWVVRGWGANDCSQRIDHGIVGSFAELSDRCLRAQYPTDRGGSLRIGYVGIDSGFRTKEVYAWSLTDPRIRVLKGGPKSRKPINVTRGTYQDPKRPILIRQHVYIHWLDVSFFQDLLAGLIVRKDEATDETTGEVTEQDAWRLNADNDDDYNAQMGSMHKVLVRKGRATPKEMWETVTRGAANHYRDDEVYQVMMADVARVDIMRPRADRPRRSYMERIAEAKAQRADRGPVRREY